MNIVDAPTFSTFGRSFQERLAFLILDDRVFADRMIEVLNVEYFESRYLQGFVSRIFDYKKQYKVHPSRDTMEIILRTSLEKENEILQKQVRDFYARMLASDHIEDGNFIQNEALDFCRKQKLHEAMIKSASLLKTNSFDEISKVINTALKAGGEIDTGHDFIKDFEKRYVENVRNPIPTGWDRLDELTSGGLGRGEYGLILAPTGAGKSLCLVHLGVQALKRGQNVVYYTLELSAEVIGLRFDSCLTGIPIDELRNHKEKVLEELTKITGQLIIKQYPKKSASMMTVKNHLSRLKSQGFIPDMIELDYLDLLKSSSIRKELRYEIGETYDEFEAVCQEDQIVGWTASQTNRCFSVDTPIYILGEDQKEHTIEIGQSKIGMMTKTVYGYEKIIDIFSSRQKVYKITLKNGLSVKVSKKHIFPTDSGDKSLESGLKIGDKFLIKK